MLLRTIFLLFCIATVLVFGFDIRENVNVLKLNKGRNDIIDGDIVIPKEQMILGKGRVQRQISRYAKKWPSGKVYYYFEPSFTKLTKDLIITAMEYISSRTCISFEQNSTAINRMKFMNSGGCASYIGSIGGEQEIWFSDGCSIIGIGVHEIMHALGIFHTQSRYDRDDFLILNLTNVDEQMLPNFEKESSLSTDNAVPYEYGSTMHYSADALGYVYMFSKDPKYQSTMGLRRVTFYDMVNINTLYNCQCPNSLECENGGYTNPSKCSECVCPEGFGGTLCDGPPNYAVQLTASLRWKGYWVTHGYKDNTITDDYLINHIVINAPADKTIQVRVVEISRYLCNNGCQINGVEIKLKGDPRITNPILCCERDPNLMNNILSSIQNPLPIVLYTLYRNQTVTIHYRYVDEPLSSRNKTTNGYDNYEFYS